MTPDLSVIVPAFNESKTIEIVVDSLINHLQSLSFEILIIDDASSDNTAEVVTRKMSQHQNIRLIRHEHNQGKTQALVTGFKECLGRVVIVQDADLEYNPGDILRVVSPILNLSADVVYGSRLLDPEHANHFLTSSLIANKVLTFVSNLFTQFKFTDVETCYKAFKREIIQNMVINSKRFGFEIEVTAKISKLNLRIQEVPISFSSRSYDEGKKIGAKDGIQAMIYILKYNLFTSKKDAFVSDPDLEKDFSK